MKAQITKISREFFNSQAALEKVANVMKTGNTIEHVEISLAGKKYEISTDDYKQTILETWEILEAADKYLAGL